ncbi:heme-binding protein [Bordetella sp. BOR01]|uniref:GlcG/HbpS family heme-binding protein n=1 Tax=Bordetella sp. BOR01 TaxID=2854779 RepID=UPI001C473824|nr:heme-binding protein [Bordetella sp. BOR01]MBV7482184.1 heme-binding protein [Bordetella sp. BOR01]
MTDITLAHANQLIDAALGEARHTRLAPMTVAVLDRGGHVVALKREDQSSTMRADIAIGKARGCLALGQSSRAMAERADSVPLFFNALAALSHGNVIPVAGGLLLKDSAGHVCGAVGVSGDTPDNDEHCALAGIAALVQS